MENKEMKTIYKDENILISNSDCFDFMNVLKEKNKKVDIVLTSPPYNNSRVAKNDKTKEKMMKNHECRYDIYIEEKTNEEYVNWTVDLFNNYNDILNENGVVLYNMSYGNENPDVMWLVIAEIINKTDFMVADTIVWKKKSALPNNVSHNKLTRITEFVFVFCRKSEYKTFNCNKKVKSYSKTGQKYYENVFNFVEAKNNDGSNNLNKATFSSDFVMQLLDIYANETSVVYDSFMGTGTTAYGCKQKGLKCIGSELSEAQCEYAAERLKEQIDIAK